MSDESPKIHREPRFFGLREVLKGISGQLLLEFQGSGLIGHKSDMGEERERFLQKFLSSGHFPKKYALSKGHGKVISTLGRESLQTDIVIYDALQCPVLRDGENHQFFPVESVYGTIQVKSRLSKEQLLDAAENIASVKRLAEHKTITRVQGSYSGAVFAQGDQNPLPLGAIFAYSLDGNSLDSLQKNLAEYHAKTDPKEWVNLICVLGEGVIYNTFDIVDRALDSRDLIRLQGRRYEPGAVHHGQDALLDFYLALIGALGMLDLLPPPLHEYVDLPIATPEGHSYKIAMLQGWKCTAHGAYEPRLQPEWIVLLANFIKSEPQKYKASVCMAHVMGQTDTSKIIGIELLDQYKAPAYIYSRDGIDPLTTIQMRLDENNRPIQMYWELEIDGEPVLLPQKFIDKEHPLFECCPKCPRGTSPVM